MKSFEALKAFLNEKGFSYHKVKGAPVVSYERVFDDRFQFILTLNNRPGKHVGQEASYSINSGIRLNFVEEVLENYAVERLNFPKGSSEILTITFIKQFLDDETENELKIVSWVKNIVDPIVKNPDKMFSYYRQSLKDCENPAHFDVFGIYYGYYTILRSIVVHLIDNTYQKDLPMKLLSKHSLERFAKNKEFVSRLGWLEKRYNIN